jgi:uncharacterized protein (TIGR01777 family)
MPHLPIPNDTSARHHLGTVVITGGTGAIGRELAVKLLLAGYSVHILTRNAKRARQQSDLPVSWIEWDPETILDPSIVEGIEALIHLAGEPVAKRRWSANQKSKILSSRIHTTRQLSQAIETTRIPPKVVISTSAIGYYGDRGDTELTEAASVGSTFLANVCQAWENEIRPVSNRSRLAIVRVGIVLDTAHGALAEMLPVFRLGIGSPLGGGKQWMSWIHHDDLTNLYLHILKTDTVSGIVNGVAPHPVTNQMWTSLLGRALGRWTGPRIPALFLRLALGEMSDIVLFSQKVMPMVAIASGFDYRYRTLTDALSALIAPNGWKNAYRLTAVQWIDQSPETVFKFFSNAYNLEQITPPWLTFKIERLSGTLAEGTTIDYRLKIKGIPIKWRTLISQWEPITQFRDEMIWGPYRTWHHTHTFEPVAGGTLMTDSVVYRLPFGVLGDIAAIVMVNRDIRSIFQYRKSAIVGRI